MIRILLVYDDWAFLNVTKWTLEAQESKFHVDTAVCVAEAMLKLLEDAYDVVVTDCRLPGSEGLEFLTELSSRKSEIPFIIFSGREAEENIVEALKNDAHCYLIWDEDPSAHYVELVQLVRAAVS